ncbi:MAG: hypothetical protein OQJ96_09500 [Flavobacteriales bacterium]|nr:hypothetical protein [Flavobacteriales bacterium]MCW8912081.1 hypothetical protein [Flavobacteriales bacterium]MCW8936721.1 hypothetical protein [Flavobacteriales bacterium]MCW8941482.1 hypothetical protein [Flavobacteriales bacterium]MCW8967126.1 hypothetical protein [Flavobacteriales bacterium]
MKLKLTILLLSALTAQVLLGQKLHYELPDNANKMYNNGNFMKAKELYRELYKKHQNNTEFKFRFGVSLLNSYEWEDGIKMLEQVSKKSDVSNEVWHYLGKGYHLTNRYDLAIKMFEKYLENDANSEMAEKSRRRINMCNNAKQLVKFPVNTHFENLGKYINSKGKEYFPIITPNEYQLMFTTRREGTTGRIYDLEGYYTADIYGSTFRSGKWSKTRSINYPNSYGNEQVAGISEDGNYVFYYVDNPKEKNTLYMAEMGKRSYTKAKKIDNKLINDKSSKQLSATISNDGQLMVFSSDKKEGYGASDLYFVKKLPNGKWGNPSNIGEHINTNLNEINPYLVDEGKTLYFASEGHNSIGGYDVFKSTFDEETQTWSKPINIGYPLNTPDDNTSICFSENKQFVYLSAYRSDSEGDLDIYRVELKDEETQLTTVKGMVYNGDSTLVNYSMQIEAFKEEGGDLQGIFEVNHNKGSYIMILPPNKYVLKIADNTGKTIEKKLWIKDRNLYKEELEQNIILSE